MQPSDNFHVFLPFWSRAECKIIMINGEGRSCLEKAGLMEKMFSFQSLTPGQNTST